MNNPIEIWISQAEENWLEMLHKHAEDLFAGAFLPSHDHTHHSRVWNISKSLFAELDKSDLSLDQSLVEGVLIASYFHDLGMVISSREDHGILGREICEEFFNNKIIQLPSRYEEILVAIGLHDDKEGPARTLAQAGEQTDILSVLSIADDLDAMGVIGIYRYIEIYLKRNIYLADLGKRVLGNAGARFKNISERCIHFPILMKEYRVQYARLLRFFEHYNEQILIESNAERVFHGHVGIVNHIRVLSVEGKTRPEDFLKESAGVNLDPIVKKYFTDLKNELDKARL